MQYSVHVGWRLAAEYWGQGLSTEGAREMVRYGFDTLGLEALVRSQYTGLRRVREKLGVSRFALEIRLACLTT